VFGTEQLVELLGGCGGMRPDDVAARIETAVMSASMGRLRDDMAVLALGPDPATAPAETVMLADPPQTTAAAQDTTKESDG
jgi:hypothetical protein